MKLVINCPPVIRQQDHCRGLRFTSSSERKAAKASAASWPLRRCPVQAGFAEICNFRGVTNSSSLHPILLNLKKGWRSCSLCCKSIFLVFPCNRHCSSFLSKVCAQLRWKQNANNKQESMYRTNIYQTMFWSFPMSSGIPSVFKFSWLCNLSFYSFLEISRVSMSSVGTII